MNATESDQGKTQKISAKIFSLAKRSSPSKKSNSDAQSSYVDSKANILSSLYN